jgi:hypothetical protein
MHIEGIDFPLGRNWGSWITRKSHHQTPVAEGQQNDEIEDTLHRKQQVTTMVASLHWGNNVILQASLPISIAMLISDCDRDNCQLLRNAL